MLRSEIGKELPLLNFFLELHILTLNNRVSTTLTLEDVIRSYCTIHPRTLLKVCGQVHYSRKGRSVCCGLSNCSTHLEENGNFEEARAVCQPNILTTISRWRNKLKVYLAPFLIGMCYTSFGRHFTKVDKLEEIVDFCGANDFSCLMKIKLEETRKECNFKNFDMLSAKNDFNFERRDWMSVRWDELRARSKLIMGLNPPFGVRAGLANKFIDKALEFKPKLHILIVPPETRILGILSTFFFLSK